MPCEALALFLQVDLSSNSEAERYLNVMCCDFHIESGPNLSWHLEILLLSMSCIAHRQYGEQTLGVKVVGIQYINVPPAGIFLKLLP